jgi:mono/diheme cytochrome c family protein
MHLAPEESKALLRCLLGEYYGGLNGNDLKSPPGVLLEYLKAPACPLIESAGILKDKSPESLGKAKDSMPACDTPVGGVATRPLQGVAQTPFANANAASKQLIARSLLNRCSQCHGGPSGVASDIPFSDLNRLKPLLVKEGYEKGTLINELRFRLGNNGPDQMPPKSVPTSPEERSILLQYLEDLK